MLVFAIACAATASLGLIAMRQPTVVGPALEKFGRWAGLFMQVAGLLEALRRLIRNPLGTFAISPAAPTVSFANAPSSPSIGGGKRSQARMTERLDNLQERTTHLVDQGLMDELMDIERIIGGYDTSVFLRSPDLDLKIKSELTKFIHHAPSGAFDDLANARDPMARKAVGLYWAIDDLAERAVTELHPEPVGAEDALAMIIASEDVNG